MLDDQILRDKKAYDLAREYLLSLNGITPEILDRQISFPAETRPSSMIGVYKRLLETAKNANMMPNVIGGIDRLETTLFEFQPKMVLEEYGDNWEMLLDDIEKQLNLKLRRTSRSLWPRFCKSVLAGAEFLRQFQDEKDLYSFIEIFDSDDRLRPSLPMLLSYEIDGIGFALACDFIKELGYLNFGKPDIHLKKIFVALNITKTEKDYQVFKAIVRVAKNVGVTPYKVDKLFWLIGSGNFYLEGIKTGQNRNKFIEHAKG